MTAISSNRTPHDSHPAPSLAVTVATGIPLYETLSVTDPFSFFLNILVTNRHVLDVFHTFCFVQCCRLQKEWLVWYWYWCGLSISKREAFLSVCTWLNFASSPHKNTEKRFSNLVSVPWVITANTLTFLFISCYFLSCFYKGHQRNQAGRIKFNLKWVIQLLKSMQQRSTNL